MASTTSRHRRRQPRPPQPEQVQRPIDRPYFTAKQALLFLELGSLGSLYYQIRENRLPYQRIGSRYRFKRTELEAWLAGERVERLQRVS